MNSMKSINPYTQKVISEFTEMTALEVEQIANESDKAWHSWKETNFYYRSTLMQKAAGVLRQNKTALSQLISHEMGKRIAESEAELEKCAWVCEYYAENAKHMLADEFIETDGQKSMAVFEPLGTVLAVMPWNYPFWQVFRFAAPALMAGNAVLLKHASNVFGSALLIEKVFERAGLPSGVFKTLLIETRQVKAIIENPIVKAVTLTGSGPAGSAVASLAGEQIKKTVL